MDRRKFLKSIMVSGLAVAATRVKDATAAPACYSSGNYELTMPRLETITTPGTTRNLHTNPQYWLMRLNAMGMITTSAGVPPITDDSWGDSAYSGGFGAGPNEGYTMATKKFYRYTGALDTIVVNEVSGGLAGAEGPLGYHVGVDHSIGAGTEIYIEKRPGVRLSFSDSTDLDNFSTATYGQTLKVNFSDFPGMYLSLSHGSLAMSAAQLNATWAGLQNGQTLKVYVTGSEGKVTGAHLHTQYDYLSSSRWHLSPDGFFAGYESSLTSRLTNNEFTFRRIDPSQAPLPDQAPAAPGAAPAQPTAAPTAVPINYQVLQMMSQSGMNLGVNDLEYSIACHLFSQSSGIPATGFTDMNNKQIKPALYSADPLYALVKKAISEKIIAVDSGNGKIPLDSTSTMPAAGATVYYDPVGMNKLVQTAKTYNANRLPFVVFKSNNLMDVTFESNTPLTTNIVEFEITSCNGQAAAPKPIRYCITHYNTQATGGAYFAGGVPISPLPGMNTVSDEWGMLKMTGTNLVLNRASYVPSGERRQCFFDQIRQYFP